MCSHKLPPPTQPLPRVCSVSPFSFHPRLEQAAIGPYDGNFVVRRCTTAFAYLSVRYDSCIFNRRILQSPRGLHLSTSARVFSALPSLLSYYQTHKEASLPCQLRLGGGATARSLFFMS